MKFKEFEYMRAIEAKKSITKAAQMLNVSQPAISRCLINLEKELGIQLFEKIDGDYVSTPAGKDVYKRQELCTALLTAILREDHFSNGSFERRQRAGQVDEILKRMVAELNK